MVEKRKRVPTDDASRTNTLKRARHAVAPDLLSPLSEELLLRILSFLTLSDLLGLSLVSNRFYRLSGDSQIWKRLYYSRFVLPRALRLPGFRNGSVRDSRLYYSSHRTLWADGRKGGWADSLPAEGDRDRDGRNWKQQYKLRHNWAKGQCAVEELPLGPSDEVDGLPAATGDSPRMLVKVLDGIAVTADVATGLRAWDLKTKVLVAQIPLADETWPEASPSCLALDGRLLPQMSLDVALGFADGGFGMWRIHTDQKRITRRYRHETSINGELIGIAIFHPYLLTATKSILISLYTFDVPPPRPMALPNYSDYSSDTDVHSLLEKRPGHEITPRSSAGTSSANNDLPQEGTPENASPVKENHCELGLPAPYLLTSLKSHSSRSPLALSLRESAGRIVASIAYTFSSMRDWSLGIQELHIRPGESGAVSSSRPEVITTQLAYTLPLSRTSRHRQPLTLSLPIIDHHSRASVGLVEEDDQQHENLPDGPISLSYTHPYLLATLSDNTLILHLCTSGSSSLSISPGIRLWGHTSGISDAEITARGKAVSVSSRGDEVRVWELEGRGRTTGNSVEVRPTITPKSTDEDHTSPGRIIQWDDERRNWVGFDDEMVIVLKESGEGRRESLLVYDFT